MEVAAVQGDIMRLSLSTKDLIPKSALTVPSLFTAPANRSRSPGFWALVIQKADRSITSKYNLFINNKLGTVGKC